MKYLLLIILVLYSFSADAQKKKKQEIKLEEPPMVDTNPAHNVYVYNQSYSARQLKRRFPLNIAHHVLLISYTAACEIYPGIVDNSNPQPVKEPEKKVKHGTDTLGYKEVREIVMLDKSQIDSLMSLMYNVTIQSGISNVMGCYLPRNSILFMNEHNEKVAYIDMCFECHNLKSSHEKLKADEALKAKYELMSNFFLYTGIKFGTIENEDGIIPKREH